MAGQKQAGAGGPRGGASSDRGGSARPGTGQDQTGQDQTGQSRTGQSRTGQDQTGQDRTGQSRTGQSRTGQSRTGQSRTGQRDGAQRAGGGRGIQGGRPGTPGVKAAPTRPGKNAKAAAARPVKGGQAATGATIAPSAPDSTDAPRWLQLTTFALSIIGFGVSVYLTYTHFSQSAPAGCSTHGFENCAAVTSSAESEVFGIFPVAVLGLAFYIFMVAINSPLGWRLKHPAVPWARLGSLVVGIIFVLYLVYTELFTLNLICLYCTSVHIATFLLFALIVFQATARAPASATRRLK